MAFCDGLESYSYGMLVCSSSIENNVLETFVWSPFYVAVSVLVCVLYSGIACDLYVKALQAEQGHKKAILKTGTIFGLGIFSMHFIGMYALTEPGPMLYDGFITFFSLIAAIIGTNFAVYMLYKKWHLVFAAVCFGSTIGVMHYSGMMSLMSNPFNMYHEIGMFTVSIVYAVIGSIISLYLFKIYPEHNNKKALGGAATMMGLTIVGMHYCAMYASDFSSVQSVQALPHDYFIESSAVVGFVFLMLLITVCIYVNDSINAERAIKAKSKQLSQKTDDMSSMLSNMQQGLFTVNEDGKVHREYALYLEKILETEQIADQCFIELLFEKSDLSSDHIAQIATAVESSIGYDKMMFDCNSHVMPREMLVEGNNGTQRSLEIDWTPIVREDIVEKIMVTVRDVTELNKLREATKQQEKELGVIGQILAVERSKFEEFVSLSLQFSNEASEIIELQARVETDAIANIFRLVHTVKGNARTFGFTYITESAHILEADIDLYRKNAELLWDVDNLLQKAKELREQIKFYQAVAQDKLDYNVVSANNDIRLNEEVVLGLIRDAESIDFENKTDNMSLFIRKTYAFLLSAEAKLLDEIFQNNFDSVNQAALKLNKKKPNINVEQNELLIRKNFATALNDIFMHVFSNSIDHGIEEPEVRTAQGKSPEGNIDVSLDIATNQIAIIISDDGKGLELDKIYEKGVALGLFEKNARRPDNNKIANSIIQSGVSTATKVTEISGRGVGMDAVRSFVKQIGGQLEIILIDSKTQQEGYAFATKIVLPKHVYIPSCEHTHEFIIKNKEQQQERAAQLLAEEG